MSGLAGSAALELADGVVHLDAQGAVLEAMLQGWARQQRARFLNEEGTIKPRLAIVRRLVEFTNLYPWQWQAADAEAFIAHLRSPNRSRPVMMSTGRGYETTLALFMSFITDGRYGWAAECLERFGQAPQQVFHEDNRVAHVAEYEGRPERRPLSYDEVQALFDAADGQVEEAQSRGRKGALTAMRDSALLKTVYAFLRHSYITHLVEFDYPEKFVSMQAGHGYASTTAIYTGVSDEYRNRVIQRALHDRHLDLWDAE